MIMMMHLTGVEVVEPWGRGIDQWVWGVDWWWQICLCTTDFMWRASLYGRGNVMYVCDL